MENSPEQLSGRLPDLKKKEIRSDTAFHRQTECLFAFDVELWPGFPKVNVDTACFHQGQLYRLDVVCYKCGMKPAQVSQILSSELGDVKTTKKGARYWQKGGSFATVYVRFTPRENLRQSRLFPDQETGTAVVM